MAALVIFGLRLLYLAVYLEATVIVVLLLILLWLYAEAKLLYRRHEEALAACDKVRGTLEAMQRMSTIRHQTAERMQHATEGSYDRA